MYIPNLLKNPIFLFFILIVCLTAAILGILYLYYSYVGGIVLSQIEEPEVFLSWCKDEYKRFLVEWCKQCKKSGWKDLGITLRDYLANVPECDVEEFSKDFNITIDVDCSADTVKEDCAKVGVYQMLLPYKNYTPTLEGCELGFIDWCGYCEEHQWAFGNITNYEFLGSNCSKILKESINMSEMNCYSELAQLYCTMISCQLSPEPWNDDCYYSTAIITKNESLCLYAGTYRPYRGPLINRTELCYHRIAVAKLNESICNNIASAHILARCYGEIARIKKDVEICNRGANFVNMDYCYEIVAVATRNVSLCEEIRDREWKEFCWGELASLLKNETICYKIASSTSKDICFMKVAMVKKDKDICNLIVSDLIWTCYGNVAGSLCDPGICYNISGREKCLEQYRYFKC